MARPNRPLLTRERIIAAALDLVDGHGVDALSMRRLAERLGVRAASLYNHVSTKEDLLRGIADLVMRQVDVSGFTTGDWRAALATWARSYRTVLAAHPNVVPFMVNGPGRLEIALSRADAVHGGLTRAGWPPRHATMIGAAVKYLVVGAALGSFAGGFSDDAQVYADRYPNLSQAHLLRERQVEIDEGGFELALTALLSGLEALYAEVGRPA
ncbi:MAG: TetR family transcriptional regulator [Streptosporangiales bacterium]|nr:TetR family transcriptional regulator [Streptosporangiales bacterium]